MEHYDQTYVDQWGIGPHTSVDALVQYGTKILIIQRKSLKWALPGGFLEPEEKLIDGALRELSEETTIGLSSDELRSRLLQVQVFDDPYRDPRARIITHAHFFWLDQTLPLPTIKANDDAINAMWIDTSSVDYLTVDFYADHRDIITTMINYVG